LVRNSTACPEEEGKDGGNKRTETRGRRKTGVGRTGGFRTYDKKTGVR